MSFRRAGWRSGGRRGMRVLMVASVILLAGCGRPPPVDSSRLALVDGRAFLRTADGGLEPAPFSGVALVGDAPPDTRIEHRYHAGVRVGEVIEDAAGRHEYVLERVDADADAVRLALRRVRTPRGADGRLQSATEVIDAVLTFDAGPQAMGLTMTGRYTAHHAGWPCTGCARAGADLRIRYAGPVPVSDTALLDGGPQQVMQWLEGAGLLGGLPVAGGQLLARYPDGTTRLVVDFPTRALAPHAPVLARGRWPDGRRRFSCALDPRLDPALNPSYRVFHGPTQQFDLAAEDFDAECVRWTADGQRIAARVRSATELSVLQLRARLETARSEVVDRMRRYRQREMFGGGGAGTLPGDAAGWVALLNATVPQGGEGVFGPVADAARGTVGVSVAGSAAARDLVVTLQPPAGSGVAAVSIALSER